MRFILSDIEGTVLDAFDDQRGAVAAAFALFESLELVPSDLVLLAYDDSGAAVGSGVRGDELLARKVRWEVHSDTVRPGRVVFSEPTFGVDPGHALSDSRVAEAIA